MLIILKRPGTTRKQKSRCNVHPQRSGSACQSQGRMSQNQVPEDPSRTLGADSGQSCGYGLGESRTIAEVVQTWTGTKVSGHSQWMVAFRHRHRPKQRSEQTLAEMTDRRAHLDYPTLIVRGVARRPVYRKFRASDWTNATWVNEELVLGTVSLEGAIAAGWRLGGCVA